MFIDFINHVDSRGYERVFQEDVFCSSKRQAAVLAGPEKKNGRFFTLVLKYVL